MQKALLPFLLAFALAFPSFAQSSDTLRLKREIGFSTDVIINGIFNATSGPIDLSYKKRMNTSWIRGGLSLSAFRNTNSSIHHSPSKAEVFSIRPSIGIEKRKEIAPKWLLLYGTDLLITATSQQSTHTQSQDPNNITTTTNKYNTLGGGLRPFLGVGFNITPRLYLSTEASGLLTASRTKRSYEIIQSNTTPSFKETEGWYSSIAIMPSSSIFFYYRF